MKEKENMQLQLVSRSFVVTLTSPEDIFAYFTTKNERNNSNLFSFLRFILAEKGSVGRGDQRLTLCGGKINGNVEDYFEASQREIIEEVGLRLLPKGSPSLLSKRLSRSIQDLTEHGEYNYHLRPQKGQVLNRKVRVNTFFVFPNFDGGEELIGDKKIRGIRELSLWQIKNLIEGGEVDGLRLEEHLRLDCQEEGKDFFTDSGKRFFISRYASKQRKRIFKRALDHFEDIDDYLRRRFKRIFEENPQINLEEFRERYWQEVVRFMRVGFERSLEKKAKAVELITEDKDEIKKIKEGLNYGFLGTDILYFMPHIIGQLVNGVNLDFILDETTEATQVFFKYFYRLIESFAGENKLRSFFQDADNLEEKIEIISSFDRFVREKLKIDFSLSDEQIDLTILYFRDFWSEFEHELKIADSRLTEGLVQNYRLLNEVANASLGKLILLMFGVEGFLESETHKKQLMFEAGRQVLLLMKGFLSVDYFNERSNSQSMVKVNRAVEEFFGEPVEDVLYPIGEKRIYATIRRGRMGPFIIDEKPPKPWLSFIRKCFAEAPKVIIDFYSCSIVYLGKDKEEFIQFLLSGKFKREFLEFLRKEFPNSRISLTERPTFGLRNFTIGNKKLEGKRRGSQSARIVAQKYILEIDGQKKELVIYPYVSTVREEIDDDNFWLGWLEKRQDDSNYTIRRMLAGENGIPSFYDLLFPSDIYPLLYKARLKATYHL